MTELSYVHGVGDRPLRAKTIGAVFGEAVAAHAEVDGLVDTSRDFRATYAELDELTSRLARALMSLGVERGDRIGLWSPNRPEWVITQIAAARIGAVVVTLNPAYRRAELEYSLNKSSVSVLVMSAAFRQTSFREILSDVRGKCASLRHVFVMEDDWDSLLSRSADVDRSRLARREASIQIDDAAYIMYTSGTTGSPKATVLSHHGQMMCGWLIGQGLGYTERDRVCLPVPMFHAFGCMAGVLACIAHASTMVLSGDAFDPAAVLRSVEQERCTSLYGVPTMFIGELALPDFASYDLGSLRTGIMAGAPCPVAVMEQVHTLMNMREVVVMYGMTETAMSTRTRVGDPFEKQIGTVGRAFPFVEIKLVGPDGAVVPLGEPGGVCVRSFSNMLGYWEDPHATGLALDDARWMHTGDVATMDREGYLKIVGRSKDMIVRGGENIFPSEVESYLHSHPDIEDVQVVGVPSERYGEEVMAYVRPRAGSDLSGTVLDRFCSGNIATYKIPKYWSFVEEFPMTASGKVQKYKLREQAITELGLEAAARIETA